MGICLFSESNYYLKVFIKAKYIFEKSHPIASLVWGYNQYQVRTKYEIALENQYQRLFYDVKKHVENVQVSISKALVAASKERNVLLFSEIMSDANFAQDKLDQLSISHAEVANTEKFLTQAADYSYYLIQKHLEG